MKNQKKHLIVLHIILLIVIVSSFFLEQSIEWVLLLPVASLILTFFYAAFVRNKWFFVPIAAINIIAVIFEQTRVLQLAFYLPAVFIFCALVEGSFNKKSKNSTVFVFLVFFSVISFIFMAIQILYNLNHFPWEEDKLFQRYLFYALFFLPLSIIAIIKAEAKRRIFHILSLIYLVLGTLNYLFLPKFSYDVLAFVPFLMVNLYPYNKNSDFLWKPVLTKSKK